MNRFKGHVITLFVATAASLTFAPQALADPNEIVFPVIGPNNYSDTFYAYRAGQVDNKHHAIDIFGPKHSHLISPVNGTVRYVGYPQDSWGWYVVIVDNDGFEYHFMHINNDNHGTDDGHGGPMLAYASDMRGEYNEGSSLATKVVKGQHIAYLGDSGNAETTPPHLHFEIVYPQYTNRPYREIPVEGFVNPYTFLNKAPRLSGPVIYPELKNELLPYGPFNPGVNVAIGNFDTDADEEFVTGAGEKGGPHVKIYEANKTFTGKEFFAYNPQHWTGTDVAAGDIDGDGIDEIITGAGPGGGPHVRAFKPDGTEVASFFAYEARFGGGVYVGAGDLNGDGKDEIITGARSGGGPHVKVFKQDGTVIGDMFAYTSHFYGGVDVAASDLNGDGKDEIITSPGPGGGPHVRVFGYTVNDKQYPITAMSEFFAYAGNFYGGVRVSATSADKKGGQGRILTVPSANGGPNVKSFDLAGNTLKSGMAYEQWWYGVNDVAAGANGDLVGTGINRRASIRQAFNPLIKW